MNDDALPERHTKIEMRRHEFGATNCKNTAYAARSGDATMWCCRKTTRGDYPNKNRSAGLRWDRDVSSAHAPAQSEPTTVEDVACDFFEAAIDTTAHPGRASAGRQIPA